MLTKELLPFRLQDLCLLEVINDLESYSVELLSSLPLRTRRRILNNIPVVDLYRLEDTPIAEGVDMEEVWKKVRQHIAPQMMLWKSNLAAGTIDPARHPFELNVRSMEERKPSVSYLHSTLYYLNTHKVLTYAFRDCKEKAGNEYKSKSKGDAVMLDILTDILSQAGPSPRQRLLTLVSLDGAKVLPNLMSDYTIDQATCYSLWKRQTTALHMEQQQYNKVIWKTILTPRRLESARLECDPLRQLQFVTANNVPQPFSANLQLNVLADGMKRTLGKGWFYQNAGLNVSADYKLCMAAIQYILKRVQILRLGSENYNSEAGVMMSVISALVSDRKECALKCLFCSLPNVYDDIVEPLFSVYSLQNFHHLFLDADGLYPPSISKVLLVYLTTPCSRSQMLSIRQNSSIPFSTFDDPNIALLDMGGATFPECAIEHKTLNFSQTGQVSLLLHLPVVRLNELCIDGISILHHCALHPDLLVRKLTVVVGAFNFLQEHSTTYEEDFGSLLKMSTLQEFSIFAEKWCDDLKVALTKAFRQRATLSLPLKKISFRPNGKSVKPLVVEDAEPLWDAIFSLPEIEQLDLTVGDGFLDFDTIYKSWLETVPLKHQLKSITIATYQQGVPKIKEDILSHLTRNYCVNPKDLRKVEYFFNDCFY